MLFVMMMSEMTDMEALEEVPAEALPFVHPVHIAVVGQAPIMSRHSPVYDRYDGLFERCSSPEYDHYRRSRTLMAQMRVTFLIDGCGTWVL